MTESRVLSAAREIRENKDLLVLLASKDPKVLREALDLLAKKGIRVTLANPDLLDPRETPETPAPKGRPEYPSASLPPA